MDRFSELAARGDEELIEKLRSSSDEPVFEELVRRYVSPAYRMALIMLGIREDAEDAVQECFLRLIRARSSYRSGMRFSRWFFAILRNVCRDEVRRRLRAAGGIEKPTARNVELDPSARLELRERVQAAYDAFDRLPEPEREALTLRIHGGLEFSEIAAICGISVEAAKKRAYRGLDRLRRELVRR